jgi:hypothetical protein
MNGNTAIFGIILGLAVAGTAARTGAQAAPGGQAGGAPRTENAKVQRRGVAGSLAQTVDTWASGADRPEWLAYSVPAAHADRPTCCGDGNWSNDGSCGACKLEGSQHGSFNLGRDKVDLEGPRKILVLFRAEGRKIGKIRMVSEDCTLDAGGLELVWLAEVNPRESVRLLERFVNGQEDDHGRERLVRGALAAIALHGDPAADEVLALFASPGKPEEMRKEAAFWSGEARGAAGLTLLKKMAGSDPSPEVRAHVTFALSVSREHEALEEMIRMAHQDSSGQVRGQALFWLAQKAGSKAAAVITGAIDGDPDTEVKTKAVFALSQMPKEEGVPKLIEVARNNRNPEVRKQAMFWLGQSNDPRALDFFEKVLSK